jgi:hypothetical protein
MRSLRLSAAKYQNHQNDDNDQAESAATDPDHVGEHGINKLMQGISRMKSPSARGLIRRLTMRPK